MCAIQRIKYRLSFASHRISLEFSERRWLPTDMLFPGHLEGDWRIAPCEVVASWSAPAFAENLAVDAGGRVFVSLHSHNRIDCYDPRTRTVEPFAELPASPAGLAFDDQGQLWITGGTLGATPGFVWRANPRGVIESWVEIPDAVFMN